MSETTIITTLFTAFVVILGWQVSHMLTSKRDLANDRRKSKTVYLIEAYRNLETASNCDNSQEKQLKIKSAIADIQLFGTKSQILLAKDFAYSFSEKNHATLDDLLFDLRRTLRIELQLDSMEEPIFYLRFKKNPT